ncbi:MAG: MBL fold metallo-hydrolase [Actinomycetota bacterium]|nr:MBL fold metallo-hydrolase [Actinomycetota bacterium]
MVAEGVHMVRDSYVNWYVVEEDGRLTIVDAGTPAGWGLLEKEVRRLGRSLGDIEALVITHAHFDHVGFAERARRELGVPVWLHENDVPLSRHPAFYRSEELPLKYFRNPSYAKVVASFARSRAFFARPLKEVRTYDGDGPLDVPGRPHVVHTPGHTMGHVALHFPERDLVIAGDAICTWDPYSGKTGPRLVARAATHDSAQARRSFDRIMEIGAGVVAVGHGDPFSP